MSNLDLNPYAAPFASLVPEPATSDGGVWRDADLLVVRKGCVLPDRCVKCNEPADGIRKTLTLYWHNPWIYILLLQILIYIIVSLIVRQSVVLPAGICRRHLVRRRWAILLAWMLFFGGLGVTILGGCFMDNRQRQEFGMPVLLIGCAMIVGSAIYAVIATRLLWAKRIDPYFAWIKGACPDYLAELPDLPLPSNSPYPPR